MAALRKENRLLEERVQERTAELAESEANLRVARDAAEQANAAKSRFLANMSHELRTPLNAIMGYAQILERDPRLDERNRERTRILNSSSQLLLHLINEVLDLSKIEAGRLEIHKGPVDLSRTLLSLIESFRPKAAQKGIHLAYEVDPAFPRAVLTDVRKIEQILFNVVGNAVKFTHVGEVRIDLCAAASQICINISDTGPGIPEAERETVFEPFYQTSASGTAAREPGTGLGLSICRRLVEALGGGIRCLGRPGGGTVFEVELPLETGAAGDNPRAMERRLRGYRGRRRSLLVVDDVKENRDIISELLEPLGFTVKHAPDGATALEQVRRGGIDLMLLDVRMAPMSGEEVLRHLEKLPGGRSFPVVSYSASLIGFSREDAITMGCDDWLPKPFLPDDLFGKLETLLALEWEWEEEPDATVVGDPEYRLSRDDLEQLRALAFRREPNGLKRLLRAILEREPDSAAVVEPLLKLLAGFRMAEISSLLDDLDSREENP
jgi:CheY-like chemotaxis protein